MAIRHGVERTRWFVAVAVCMGFAACHERPAVVPAPSPQPAPAVVSATPPPAPPRPNASPEPARSPAPLTDAEIFARTSLADLNARQPLEDTFFEYDQAELSESARTSLARDAAWMRKWTGTQVRVEGHADDRGTNEYNLALGERRAAVTRDYLVSLGIDRSRIATVSKGEEAPFCAEPSDACWRLNRRGHFTITAK